VAISNHRLLTFDPERVTFRWKHYAGGGKQGQMTLTATEFLRRFFLHVLPKGFVAHPSSWLSGESVSGFPPGVESTTPGFEQRSRRANWNLRRALRECLSLAGPTPWRIDDRDSEIYS
jgi:hypothetical protein